MRVRRVLLIIASLVFGAVLVLFVVRLSKIEPGAMLQQLRRVSIAVFAKLVLFNIALVFLSTEKWRSVDAALRRSSDQVPSRITAFAVTSAGMALGLVLPVQLGMATARTLGTHFYGRAFKRGTAGTLFEQAFDLLIVCFLAVASAVTWVSQGGAGTWAACAVAMTALALLSVGPAMRLVRWLANYAVGKFASHNLLAAELKDWSHLEDSSVLSSALARRLVTLSALRFAVIVLMAAQTARAVDTHVGFWQMAAMLPFVVFANLLAITPGGIGVNELTAVIALKAFGISTFIAAEWSLSNRVLIMASSFVVAAFSVIGLILLKLRIAGAKPTQREFDVTK